MAQIPVRLNTQQMAFPLLSQFQGRTVISSQGDLTYVQGFSTDGEVPRDVGIPGMLYCHNVMPSVYGWQSIGYSSKVEGLAGTQQFKDIELIQGAVISGGSPESSSLRTYIGKRQDPATGNATLYALNPSNAWVQISNTPTFPAGRGISVAHIEGFSYICIDRTGVYVYDIAANSLISRNLKGLTNTTIEGVVATSGYLMAWTTRRVLWSSTVDAEDFVPDEVTGAGGGGIQEAAGPIVTCMQTMLGIIIYTTANAVSGVYSGNADFPFNFKAIPSAGGIYDAKLVSEEAANGYHYAYTTNGIQRITHNQSTTILPSVTDFIDGNIFEDFNESTQELVQQIATSTMNRRLQIIANRYIAISYALSDTGIYTHAIVVDLVTNRMGKIRNPHWKIFEWRAREIGTFLDSRSSLALLHDDGAVSLLNFDLANNSGEGVALIGKLQLERSRLMQLDRVEVENVQPGIDFELVDHLSYNGKSLDTKVQGYKDSDNSSHVRDFLFNHVAVNHTLIFQGTFNLLSIVVHISNHGKY